MEAHESLSEEIVAEVPALQRYARILTRSVDKAEDLVQDCVERALSRANLYRRGTNLRAWLFTIMRNIVISQQRRNKLHHAYINALVSFYEMEAVPANQTAFIVLRESFDLMQYLSEGERQAIIMLGLYDLSYEEAAHRAGVPVGTVKSRLSRGRQRLRRMMETNEVSSASSSRQQAS